MTAGLLRSVILGDMEAVYRVDEAGVVGLELNPAGREAARQAKTQAVDSLVQIRLRGDEFPFDFANGHTMRNGASVRRFRVADQAGRRIARPKRLKAGTPLLYPNYGAVRSRKWRSIACPDADHIS